MDRARAHITRWALMAARILILSSLCGLVSSCGVGALIVAGVIAGLIATDGGGSSGPVTPAATAFLSPSPDRASVRDAVPTTGRPGIVPICYRLESARAKKVTVEYASETENFETWHNATRLAAPAGGGPCPDSQVFWWDPAADLDLDGRAERVRVRVLTGGSEGSAARSLPFHVGNTPPEVEILPTSDDEGEIILTFTARDAEGDPLEDVELFYALPPAYDEVRIELEEPLQAPQAPPVGAFYFVKWDSRTATENHNVHGLEMRLRCRDAFGSLVESASLLDFKNNRRAEARLVASTDDLETSFEVPIPFRLFDEDSHKVDVVVQFARTEERFGENERFPPLAVQGEWDMADPELRRRVLTDPAEAETRLRLHIATPSPRTRRVNAALDLPAAPAGVDHVFVWDTARDLSPVAVTSVRLRITPYDEDPGFGVETSNDFLIQNDIFPTMTDFAGGEGAAGGVAAGDLDGDGRRDVAVSLPEALSYPEDPSRSDEHGRVDVYYRAVDGSLAAEPHGVVPGPAGAPQPVDHGPLDLLIADMNGDGLDDLVVMDTNCPRGGCQGREAIGDVSIFHGRAAPARLSRTPDVILEAGGDVRSIAAGDFDGAGGLDLAVANHATAIGTHGRVEKSVGVFLQGPGGTFSGMKLFEDCLNPNRPEDCGELGEPGVLTSADFDGDGRDEIAVRERPTNRVLILRLSPNANEVELSVELDLESFGLPQAEPVSVGAVDLDGDSAPDLVVGSRIERAAFRFRNLGGGAFGSPAETCLTGSPEKLRVIDVTRDGQPDIVALGRSSAEIAELPGAGDCCAAETACVFRKIELDIPSEAAFPSTGFAVEDLNGDGGPDLLFASEKGAHLLLAERPGTIAARDAQTLGLELGSTIEDLLVADFNGDGRNDLAAGLSRSGAGATGTYKVLLFFQDARGRFAGTPGRTLLATPGADCDFQKPLFLADADLDGDETADVIAMSREEGVDVFWKAEGQFPERPTGSIGACGSRFPTGPLLLGDFDDAPDTDLLLLDSLGDGTRGRILIFGIEKTGGDARATQLRAIDKPALVTERLPLSMTGGDFNGDGLTDLVLFHGPSGKVTVLAQERRSASPSFRVLHEVNAQAGSGLARPTDLDADGRLDLLVSLATARRVLGFCQVAGEVGEGTLTLKQSLELDPGTSPAAAAGGDLNGDDLPDVVVSVAGDAALRTFHQKGGAGFTPLSSWPVGLQGGLRGKGSLWIRDVSGDSRADLILLGPGDREITIWRAR